MKKKFLAGLLTLCMALAMLPVEAFAAESTTESITLAEPQVTRLTVSYEGGETVELLGAQATVSLPVGSKPVFTVTFDDTTQLNTVFVASTKDGETKYLEAKLQDGQYVTDDYFDPKDTNYIPGTISVVYSKKTVKVNESSDASGIDINTLKAQLSSQGISIRNESKTDDGAITAQIVLDSMFDGAANVYVDAMIDEFVASAGVDQSELDRWLGVYKDLNELSSYDLESVDGNPFTLYLSDKDLGDSDTYLMMVRDTTSNKFTKMLITKTAGSLGLTDIASEIQQANFVSSSILNYNAITQDMNSLREEVSAHPAMTSAEKTAANGKIDALERDQKLFLMGMTFIPMFLGTAGVATPLMVTALLAGYSSISDYFWDYRIGMIQGCEPATSDFAISGTCGEHLIWSLNGEGTLTISGYGPMTEFPSSAYLPWQPAKIKSVVINPGATSIGRTAFAYATELSSVSIPDTVESIGDYAFYYCYSLTKIIIPGSVSVMGKNVFEHCVNLHSVGPIGGNYDIQFGWTEEIPANAFLSIGVDITSVVIPDGIKAIGDDAFYLTEIESVQLPDSLISIGDNAFGNTKLTHIEIPDNVTNIGKNAFYSCIDLASITLPSGVTSIGSLAFENTAYINNPSNWENGVLYIGNSLIESDRSLSGEYYIRPGTRCVADYAFGGRHDNLTRIIVPSTITHIGRESFYGCQNLDGVYFEGNAPSIYSMHERSFYNRTKIYYLEGKTGWDIDTYSEWFGYPASIWKKSDCEHIYESVVTAPTCTESGYTTYTCSKCGDSYTDNSTAALGHTYSEWVIMIPATSTTNGQRERTCSKCDNKETDIIPATGNVSGGSSSSDGNSSSTGGASSSGSSSSGGNSSSSSNSNSSNDPNSSDSSSDSSTPSLPVSTATASSGTATTATPSASVNGDTATVIVSGDVGTEIVKQATEYDSQEVVIAPEISSDVRKSEVSIPASIVADMSEKADAALTISTPVADVTIPHDTLVNLSDGTELITIIASSVTDETTDEVTYTVAVEKDGEAVSAQEASGVTATLPASVVADMAENTDAALTVSTPVASVTIPNNALSNLSDSAEKITVTASVVTNVNTSDISYTVTVEKDGKTVDTLNSGMKIALPVEEERVEFGQNLVAIMVDDNRKETIIPKSIVNDDGKMVVLMETGSATIKYVNNTKIFVDTIPTWCKDAVQFTASRELFQGMEDGSFASNIPMSRAMLATVLYRLEGNPSLSVLTSFDDVPANTWYTEAAAWAASKGIVQGDGNGFSGDRDISREELAVMLYRYVKTINGNKGQFSSYSHLGGASDVSDWADEAMRWAVGSGILKGDENGNLNPRSSATRGEVATMLMRFVALIAS